MTNRRLLKAKEISCRIQQINEKGASLLLYITSRAGQNLLDEQYGVLGWQRHHKVIDGNVYCTVSVWDSENKQWVEKEDVGKASYTEKEKGVASDSFKRACVNFGFGRELYSAPFIWIPESQINIKKKTSKDGRDTYYTKDTFRIKRITYKRNGDINSLQIVNQNLETVYKLYPSAKIDVAKLNTLKQEIERTGIELTVIYEMCDIDRLEDMLQEDYVSVFKSLLATPSKENSNL